jgi:acyl carrier protein
VKLGELPLTANGKVDRGRLPEAGERGEEGEVGYVAPGTAIEEQLCAIWAEVLSLPKVGVHDNFFDLGGHSLLMIRLKNKLDKHFQKKVSVIDLFVYTSVRALGRFLNDDNTNQEHLARLSGKQRASKRRQLLGRLSAVLDLSNK